jgi:hypothetical protein
MSDKKEQPIEKKQEPGLPVKIPLSIVRWLAYSLLFTVVLIPAMWELNIWWTISPSLILGHFASQLNALIKK